MRKKYGVQAERHVSARIQSPTVKKKINFMSQTLFWGSSITGVFIKIVEYLSEDYNELNIIFYFE